MNRIENNIGENLSLTRERKMLTQAELAMAAGVSPTTVSGIECGRIPRPRFGTLRKLSEALSVSPEELFSGSGSGVVESASSPAISVDWAMAVKDAEFEVGIESCDAVSLMGLVRDLETEKSRLRNLYRESSSPVEKQSVKSRIRHTAACIASIEATAESYRAAI